MDNGPLVKEEIDAGRELIRKLNQQRPVKAAFWLKASDKPYRYLYLAAERTDAHPDDLTYREVSRVEDELQSLELDPFRTKVIGADHPLARAAVEVADQYPASTGRRQGEGPFGNLFADDSYIYPLPLPALTVEGGPNPDIRNGTAKVAKSSLHYKIAFHRDEEGISVSVPALPGCWSEGNTEEEAMSNIRDAIREYLAGLEDHFRDAEVREVEVQA